MSTSPRSHASMSGVTPFLSCGGRTGEARGGRRGQASSRPGAHGGDGSRGIRGPAREGRATGGAEGTATPREGRGGDRPGTPGRRRREAPRRPRPRPRRSPRGATAASSSPPTARRGEGRSATRRSEPLRSESSTGTPASFGASRFRPGGVHRSSPRARLGRASFFESVVRPTSRRFLGPDTWAFLTRPSRVVPLDDRQRLVFVASILRRTRARSARRAARRRRPGPERARSPSHTRSTRGAERGRSSPGDRAGAVESARATFPGRGLGLGRRRGGERADHRRVRRGARLEARYDGLRCVPAGIGVEVEVRVRVPRPGPRRRDVLPVRHLRACPSASLSPGPAPRRARDEDATGGEEI